MQQPNKEAIEMHELYDAIDTCIDATRDYVEHLKTTNPDHYTRGAIDRFEQAIQVITKKMAWKVVYSDPTK